MKKVIFAVVALLAVANVESFGRRCGGSSCAKSCAPICSKGYDTSEPEITCSKVVQAPAIPSYATSCSTHRSFSCPCGYDESGAK